MGYEADIDVEVKRLQAHVARLGDEVERWRQACRLDTPDELVGALAEYARTLEETRDQAKTATREAEQLRVRLLPGNLDAVHALETLNRCRQDLDTAVRERDAAQNQCAEEQRHGNDMALLLRDMRRVAPHEKERVCLLSGEYDLFHSTPSPRCAACRYDESIRTDAPPPVDWKARRDEVVRERVADREAYDRKQDELNGALDRAESAEADCAAMREKFEAYFEHHSADHEQDGCPEDDTCECPLVVGINEALARGGAGAALLERLRAAEAEVERLTLLSGSAQQRLRAAVAVVEAARENWKVSTVRPSPFPKLLAAYDALAKPDSVHDPLTCHAEPCPLCPAVLP